MSKLQWVNETREHRAQRTSNIAKARNKLLEMAKEIGHDYFIMMDTNNYSCVGTINHQLLKERHSDKFDAVSFNREAGYYDHWALSFEPYVHSFFHWSCWRDVVAKMREDFDNVICNLDAWIPVLSAFNGFSLYKLHIFEDCHYTDLIDISMYPEGIGSICKQLNAMQLPGVQPLNKMDGDCEHRSFHLQAIKKHGDKIMILNKQMFSKS